MKFVANFIKVFVFFTLIGAFVSSAMHVPSNAEVLPLPTEVAPSTTTRTLMTSEDCPQGKGWHIKKQRCVPLSVY
jgi:hypothetical protein